MENSNIVCTDSQIEKTKKHYIDYIGFFPTARDTLNNDVEVEHSLIALVRDYLSK